MTDVLQSICKKIDGANDIALFCHTNPDCDALGSMLALYYALKNDGKDVYAYCDSPIPESFSSIFDTDAISFPQKRVHELAVSLDSGSVDRLGQCMKSFLSARDRVAIDHHSSFEKFAPLCYVDKSASACAEIVFEMLQSMDAIDSLTAKLLFCGIVTDSGCFSYSNTTKRTHEIACKLLEYRFDANEVICKAYKSTSAEKFRLKHSVLSRAKFYEDNKIALICFMKDDFDATSTSSDDTQGVVSELIEVDSVQVAYALAQVGQRNFKLSIRTKFGIDASEIAMTFGGGGHKNAAGCRVNGYLDDIIEKLVKLAKDRI